MTAGTVRSSTRRAAALVTGLLLVVLTACVPPSVSPDGSVSQAPPIAANGVAVGPGDTVWMADLFGGQLLQIDLADGDIVRRIGPDLGIAPPDDLVLTPDGSIVYTSPTTGTVGRVRLGAGTPTVEVLARMPTGVNPIALVPDGTAVVVGYGSGETDRIDRIDLATGAVTTVAVGVADLNGFSFGPDGALWAPIGGALSAFSGEGGVVRIDIGNGVVSRLPLSFPDEPGKRGLQFGVSLKWTPDGRLLGFQGVGAALYAIDPVTGESRRFSTIGSDVGDNQVGLPDGRVVVTGFFGTMFVVGTDGVSAPLPLGG